MMEFTIEVSPQLLNSGQVITLQREDLQLAATNGHQNHSCNTNQFQVSEDHPFDIPHKNWCVEADLILLNLLK
jgi:hypothetical protein